MINVSEQKMAEWWCQLDGGLWPDDLLPPLSATNKDAAIRGAFMVVNHFAHREGLALSLQRQGAGLDPATGRPINPDPDAIDKARMEAEGAPPVDKVEG